MFFKVAKPGLCEDGRNAGSVMDVGVKEQQEHLITKQGADKGSQG